MRTSFAALGLVGLAAAAPSCPAPAANLGTSKGVNLRVKLQDGSKDLASPVAGQYVTSIHDGAGTNLVGFTADRPRVFYVNGTDGDSGRWTTLSDGGTPAVPYGIALHGETGGKDSGVQIARMDAGDADPGIYAPEKDSRPALSPDGWLACEEELQYYGGKKFNVLRHTEAGKDAPEECVGIQLLPECATLEDLPEGALASHEFARTVSCYKDASKA